MEPNPTTIITYKDGQQAVFNGGNAVELDLNTQTGKDIFSITVLVFGRPVCTCYNWHNEPME